MNELEAVLNNIDYFLSEGIINEEKAEELAEKAINDYNGLIGENNISQYNKGELNMSNMAEFSATYDSNYFGDSLMALGESLGYDDVFEYATDLADSIGVDPEEMLAVLGGDILPSSDLVDIISDVLDVPEDIYDDLQEAAIESIIEDAELYGNDEEDYYDYEDEYEFEEEYYPEEYDDEQEYYEDYYEEPEYYEGGSEAEELALAALQEAEVANYNAAVLQEQMAEFSAVAEIDRALSDRDLYAQSLVMQGKMPPAVYEDLFGNFSSNDERIAAFSQVCEINGTDASAELYSMDKILDTFENYGDTALFNRHAYDVVDEEEVLEELLEYDQAALNRQLAYAKKANLI